MYNYLVWRYWQVKRAICAQLLGWSPKYSSMSSSAWPLERSRSYLFFGRAACNATWQAWRWRVRIDGMTYTDDPGSNNIHTTERGTK
ncbi:hypothetical protein LCGC14_3126320 [marine sediment metagenome]|uniref:Uncharacterized protein n=1 Tax=marine sediment metagenome TaxID=412755 RepID=A0A0F8Y858_9ZZZZ